MSWRVTVACAAALPLAAAVAVGYEEDAEFHAHVPVFRRARVVPIWDRIPDDHREALHWNAGPPPQSGDKYVTQWFLFGLDKRVRAEHKMVSGAVLP